MFDSHYELKNNFDNFKHPQFTHRNVIVSLGTANSFTKFLIFCNFLSKLITFDVTKILMQRNNNNLWPKRLAEVTCEMSVFFPI